jgi:hypothetical protein
VALAASSCAARWMLEFSRLMFNRGWDWMLNQRNGIPVPFTFRSGEEWMGLFGTAGYRLRHTDSYRPKWPTLGMYHHTLSCWIAGFDRALPLTLVRS